MNREKVIDRLRKQEVFIITHVPKTSGSSLSYILRDQKSKVFWPHYEKTNSVPEYISGHMPYGLHKLWGLDESNVRYCIILRDPIRRWKSIFNYALMRHNEGAVRKISCINTFQDQCHGNIEKFLQWCIDNSCNRDIMVKMASGDEDVSNIDGYKDHYEKKGKLYFSQTSQVSWGTRKNKISDDKMKDMTEKAKYNLLNKYYFVGFTEDNDNQKKICEALGLKVPASQVFKRRSVKDKKINWGSSSVEEMLIELNKYDIKLYEFAKNTI